MTRKRAVRSLHMGSPDDVGAAHQVLDGILLDLDVSADFLPLAANIRPAADRTGTP